MLSRACRGALRRGGGSLHRRHLPAASAAACRLYSSATTTRDESLDAELARVASYSQTSVSLKAQDSAAPPFTAALRVQPVSPPPFMPPSSHSPAASHPCHETSRPCSNITQKRLRRRCLQATLDTGLGLLLPGEEDASGMTRRQRTLIQIATFLKRELPVRLARRVIELKQLPEGLDAMPSVIRVREWYEQSFVEIRRSQKPVDAEGEAEFCELLHNIYQRHAPTLVTMARGVHELRQKLRAERGEKYDLSDAAPIHGFLDSFYMSRIGIRILIGQYLELHHETQPEGYVGLINRSTSPAFIAEQAMADATYLCERTHGDAPEVLIEGATGCTFTYIPSHLYYCLFELLKNSLRAVCETHGVDGEMPPIKVVIASGEQNEDVVIKVSDEGGGIPRSHMPRIFSYLFTTATPAFDSGSSIFSSAGDHGTDSPLAGLGYGLPISRTYARYFGGDLNIMSMEGYGTDAFLHLSRLGNRSEPLP